MFLIPPTSRRGVVDVDADYAYFKIGEMCVGLRSELAEVMEDFAHLYDACREAAPRPEEAIHVEIRRARRSPLRAPRYVIRGDGQDLWVACRANEVLPYVEWGINWRVIASRSDYLQVHAATMVRSGQGVLLAAKSGSGKSTLAAGLLSRGWGYLSDEFALIHPETRDLHGFPKAVCVKAGAFGLVRRLNLPLLCRRHYVKALKGQVGYVSPYRIGPGAVARSSPVRWIIFPKYVQGAVPHLVEIPRAEAAFAMAEASMNRNAFGSDVMAILSELTRGARCFRLRTGDIGETCDLLESLVAPTCAA